MRAAMGAGSSGGSGSSARSGAGGGAGASGTAAAATQNGHATKSLSKASTAADSSSSSKVAKAIRATQEHAAHCFDALIAHFRRETPPKEGFATHTDFPFFVTWNKYDRRGGLRLRGCIGNLSPQLLTRLKEYALTSALEDRRFDPVRPEEVRQLHCGVSLLVDYEDGSSWSDWVPGKHGIVIKFTQGRKRYSATYLPEVAKEQNWTVKEAIDSLIRKSGFNGAITSAVRDSIELTRYQSSKAGISYKDYLTLRGYSTHPV